MMTTKQEHLTWLMKHCDEIAVLYTVETCEWEWCARIGDKRIDGGQFLDEEEASRSLCDEVCEYLGDKCE